MINNPIVKFERWWDEVKRIGLKHPGAVCVSTIDEQGFPSGRFVDLKDIADDCFIFCTNLDSQKGHDIEKNDRVALTFWWEAIGYQVRIIGHASQISSEAADRYWDTRPRDAQITTLSCQQSKLLISEKLLQVQFEKVKASLEGVEITRPDNWGGYAVKPVMIEFLTFKASRLHLRERYTIVENEWSKELLQP